MNKIELYTAIIVGVLFLIMAYGFLKRSKKSNNVVDIKCPKCQSTNVVVFPDTYDTYKCQTCNHIFNISRGC
mgnify:CR=1 FL=1